jgi:hypothetical protein
VKFAPLGIWLDSPEGAEHFINKGFIVGKRYMIGDDLNRFLRTFEERFIKIFHGSRQRRLVLS